MSRGEMGRFSLASAGTGTVRGEERWLASACNALPGWRAVDRYPERSPLAIADFLLPRVAGKRLCEIGTRNGDIMATDAGLLDPDYDSTRVCANEQLRLGPI